MIRIVGRNSNVGIGAELSHHTGLLNELRALARDGLVMLV